MVVWLKCLWISWSVTFAIKHQQDIEIYARFAAAKYVSLNLSLRQDRIILIKCGNAHNSVIQHMLLISLAVGFPTCRMPLENSLWFVFAVCFFILLPLWQNPLNIDNFIIPHITNRAKRKHVFYDAYFRMVHSIIFQWAHILLTLKKFTEFKKGTIMYTNIILYINMFTGFMSNSTYRVICIKASRIKQHVQPQSDLPILWSLIVWIYRFVRYVQT